MNRRLLNTHQTEATSLEKKKKVGRCTRGSEDGHVLAHLLSHTQRIIQRREREKKRFRFPAKDFSFQNIERRERGAHNVIPLVSLSLLLSAPRPPACAL